MGLETASTIAELQETNPLPTDAVSAGDDHLRLIKAVLKSQFPGKGGNGLDAPLTATEDDLNNIPTKKIYGISVFLAMPAIDGLPRDFYTTPEFSRPISTPANTVTVDMLMSFINKYAGDIAPPIGIFYGAYISVKFILDGVEQPTPAYMVGDYRVGGAQLFHINTVSIINLEVPACSKFRLKFYQYLGGSLGGAVVIIPGQTVGFNLSVTSNVLK